MKIWANPGWERRDSPPLQRLDIRRERRTPVSCAAVCAAATYPNSSERGRWPTEAGPDHADTGLACQLQWIFQPPAHLSPQGCAG
jgi:hypothetical protein